MNHTQVKKAVRVAIKKVDPEKKLITYEMSRFRHAIINASDKVGDALKKAMVRFDIPGNTMTYVFVFENKMVLITYNHVLDEVWVKDEDKEPIKTTYEELPNVVYSLIPHKKVVIKIKKRT